MGVLVKRRSLGSTTAVVLSALCLVCSTGSFAGAREQAKRIHDRLVGVPPTTAVLDSMTAKVEAGDATGAALEAMANPAFYMTTVRDFATPWTNRAQSIHADLNDSTATVVGMVRDDVPFVDILSADVVYVGSAAATGVPYAHTDNDHYQDLQANAVDLSDPTLLVSQSQSGLAGSQLGTDDTAGIMTTRGFAEAFLVAGTNRAAVRFATLNFMCMDMEDFRDVTAWPDRIRQDVSRSPGGDSSLFLNDCLSCHAGLDGLGGAFAYYDFNEDTQQLDYTDGVVHPKYFNDAATFAFGFETLGDSWVNYWRSGPNAFVGWRGAGSGMGAKSLGMELAETRQFSTCQVTKAFEKVCHRTPNGAADLAAVESIADSFEATNHSMKQVFADAAVHCMGE